jgi:hypothetical protein
MTAKDVLLVLGGVAIGYFAFKMNFMKKTKMVVEEIATDLKDVVVDTAKVTKCEIEFDEKASTMRFASKEAREEAKALFMKECLAK